MATLDFRSAEAAHANLSSGILLRCIRVVTILSVSLGVLQEFPEEKLAMPPCPKE